MFDYITLIKAFIGLYGSYVTLGLICFVVLCILTIFLVSILTKTPVQIGLGFFKLSFGNKGVNPTLNKGALISSLLEHQESHIRNMVEVEEACFKKQISYCEQKLQEIKYILTSSYADLLATKLPQGEDLKLHRDFRSYQILIGILIKELLDKIFQELLIQNHLEEMDENTWKNYVTDKTTYIINFGTDFLDQMYGTGKLVTRYECYEAEKKSSSDIKAILKTVFENVREMAIQNRLELKKEKEDSEKHIKEICQNNGLFLEP